MAEIVGIKFDTSSKIYGFRAEGIELRKGDRVVVESELGVSLGRVAVMDCPVEDPDREIKPLLRKATDEDLRKEQDNASLKEEALAFCNEKITARGLPMKLVATEATLDRKRLIFYFVADNRVDFRELVKDLASKFRTRIELRQIGVRDAASVVGGMGICGREFCCRSFLKSFYPISIKMAKQQDLVLNTAKLSGTCGRLMCCLQYEYETREEKAARQELEAREAEVARKEEEARKVEEARQAEEAEKLRKAMKEKEPREAAKVEGPATPGAGKAETAPGREQEKPRQGRRRGRRRRSKQGKAKAGEAAPQKDAAKTQATESGGQEKKPGGARKRRWRPKKKK
jgi:cell fate regulator YaaT (PSP1 superfamily)